MRIIRVIFSLAAALIFLLGVVWFVGSQPLFLTPGAVEVPSVSPRKLESHVRMLSETLPARIGREENLKPTVHWIEQQLKPYGKTQRQTYVVGGEKFHNILLDFGPNSDEVIIVGAHYDTAHGFPGADDNASGVAVLIELAHLLSEARQELSMRVELVFYTLEEPPYFRTNKMGSFIHASNLKDKQQKIRVMIALDMVGYFSDEQGSQHFPVPALKYIYPDKGNFIAIVGNLNNTKAVRRIKRSFITATDLPVYSFNAPSFIVGIDFSDHLNYWKHGYDAVLVTDTSFNRNTAYHTTADTADRLDYVKMSRVVQSLYQAVLDYSL
ncbi:MAG TPA: M28 family peptidase [Chromatiaceae bacterium]|nr:M28 family peptidase [Chromatiaceae bacterium]